MWLELVTFVGAVTVLRVVVDALWNIAEFGWSVVRNEGPLNKRFGPWAVVTGGTDGIGKQYCLELAQRGLNIVIIARNQEKLRDVAAEIESKYNVETKTVVADFSRGAEVYDHIEQELKDIHVGILVNNVGTINEYPMGVDDTSPSKSWEMINVNVGAVTAMTRLVLPSMLDRECGAIVNISSVSELQPTPLLAIYAATKAYVRSYTLSLQEEYRLRGIHVQHVAPCYVATNMVAYNPGLLRGNMFVPDAKAFAKQAVATLGRVRSTSGYWSHGIQTFFMKLTPEGVRVFLIHCINEVYKSKYVQNIKVDHRDPITY